MTLLTHWFLQSLQQLRLLAEYRMTGSQVP